MRCEIHVDRDSQATAHRAAAQVTALLAEAIAASGRATIALSGGRTPRTLYETLVQPPYRDRVAWPLVEWFWGDERPVPPDHPESNYRLAAETLFVHLPVDPRRVHRVPTELGAEAAATAYESVLRTVFAASAGAVPEFDLILLGLGSDGHIASLFPGTAALHEAERLVIANQVPQLGTTRITFTPPLIRAARHILVLVTGADKAAAVREALEGPDDPERIPAHLLRRVRGSVLWMLDQAAARELSTGSGPCP
jgi:6-phosphogluconolactonase